VRLDGRSVSSRSRRVHEGEVLEADIAAPVPEESVRPESGVVFEVVYSDESVVVVDKPPGLVVHPGAGHENGTLVAGLLARFADMADVGDAARPGIVHRLDRGTSGLLVAARTVAAYESLVTQLRERTVEREYTALLWGDVEADSGVVDAPIGRSDSDPTRMSVTAGGREARTRYDVERRFTSPAATTLTAFRLETGRTHQIRVHAAAIGHPVVGDPRYGGIRPTLSLGRPFLHARRLAFIHPASGDRLEFTSALPPDLEAVLGACG
jgi:23S rRNA pseudouridine1911/1915/1917 synthase